MDMISVYFLCVYWFILTQPNLNHSGVYVELCEGEYACVYKGVVVCVMSVCGLKEEARQALLQLFLF